MLTDDHGQPPNSVSHTAFLSIEALH